MNELTLYDQTRQKLRHALAGRFPDGFDLENTLIAYAYWVCTVVRNRGKDWETTIQEYASLALSDAVLESQAEQIELDLLRAGLGRAAGPLLDVGAGWGRYAGLYHDLGLQAVYLEPSYLGCQLQQRSGLRRSVRSLGQRLGFKSRAFGSAVIGWVLHHDAPEVPAAAILDEIARVLAPGGLLLSVEPLSGSFDEPKWRSLLEASGFAVQHVQVFFEMAPTPDKTEQYACLSAVRQATPA